MQVKNQPNQNINEQNNQQQQSLKTHNTVVNQIIDKNNKNQQSQRKFIRPQRPQSQKKQDNQNASIISQNSQEKREVNQNAKIETQKQHIDSSQIYSLKEALFDMRNNIKKHLQSVELKQIQIEKQGNKVLNNILDQEITIKEQLEQVRRPLGISLILNGLSQENDKKQKKLQLKYEEKIVLETDNYTSNDKQYIIRFNNSGYVEGQLYYQDNQQLYDCFTIDLIQILQLIENNQQNFEIRLLSNPDQYINLQIKQEGVGRQQWINKINKRKTQQQKWEAEQQNESNEDNLKLKQNLQPIVPQKQQDQINQNKKNDKQPKDDHSQAISDNLSKNIKTTDQIIQDLKNIQDFSEIKNNLKQEETNVQNIIYNDNFNSDIKQNEENQNSQNKIDNNISYIGNNNSNTNVIPDIDADENDDTQNDDQSLQKDFLNLEEYLPKQSKDNLQNQDDQNNQQSNQNSQIIDQNKSQIEQPHMKNEEPINQQRSQIQLNKWNKEQKSKIFNNDSRKLEQKIPEQNLQDENSANMVNQMEQQQDSKISEQIQSQGSDNNIDNLYQKNDYYANKGIKVLVKQIDNINIQQDIGLNIVLKEKDETLIDKDGNEIDLFSEEFKKPRNNKLEFQDSFYLKIDAELLRKQKIQNLQDIQIIFQVIIDNGSQQFLYGTYSHNLFNLITYQIDLGNFSFPIQLQNQNETNIINFAINLFQFNE